MKCLIHKSKNSIQLLKIRKFTNFLDVHQPELAIVFGRTKRRVDELTSALISKGYKAEGMVIHKRNV